MDKKLQKLFEQMYSSPDRNFKVLPVSDTYEDPELAELFQAFERGYKAKEAGL